MKVNFVLKSKKYLLIVFFQEKKLIHRRKQKLFIWRTCGKPPDGMVYEPSLSPSEYRYKLQWARLPAVEPSNATCIEDDLLDISRRQRDAIMAASNSIFV